MAAEFRPLQHDVARTLAAALTVYVNIVQAMKPTSNCGVGEYYDEVIGQCRDCRLICDAVYQTSQECADKCPAPAGITITQLITEPSYSGQFRVNNSGGVLNESKDEDSEVHECENSKT